ncbi:hypothetical protein, partial [Caballeronia sp. INML1]|uniref:hypothetical protein n=1 Tax=Caballeronia sp. INML1 TaxID=2921760 RepID=UPI002029141C
TMNKSLECRWQRNSSKTVSEIPGALQREMVLLCKSYWRYLLAERPPSLSSQSSISYSRIRSMG